MSNESNETPHAKKCDAVPDVIDPSLVRDEDTDDVVSRASSRVTPSPTGSTVSLPVPGFTPLIASGVHLPSPVACVGSGSSNQANEGELSPEDAAVLRSTKLEFTQLELTRFSRNRRRKSLMESLPLSVRMDCMTVCNYSTTSKTEFVGWSTRKYPPTPRLVLFGIYVRWDKTRRISGGNAVSPTSTKNQRPEAAAGVSSLTVSNEFVIGTNERGSCAILQCFTFALTNNTLASFVSEMGLGKVSTLFAFMFAPSFLVAGLSSRCFGPPSIRRYKQLAWFFPTCLTTPQKELATLLLPLFRCLLRGEFNSTSSYPRVFCRWRREAELKKVLQGKTNVLLTTSETLVSDYKAREAALDEKEQEKLEAANFKSKKKAKPTNEMMDAWKPKKRGSRRVRRDESDDSESEFEVDSSEDEDDHYLPSYASNKRKAHKTKLRLLDEAHTIRKSGARFQAVMALTVEHKLAITGTPFVDRPLDLHPLFVFLEAAPLDDKGTFRAKIQGPIEARKEIGLARIRTMMSSLALRRTKALVNDSFNLPPKEVIVKVVPWGNGGNFHKGS
eukprot:scaffold2707_cov169-Amphora_coffeaeformis.AAC.7